MNTQTYASEIENPATYSDLNSSHYADSYAQQDEFLFISKFLPPTVLNAIKTRLPGLRESVHRNFIPRHKKGGSISRHTLDKLAPEIAALYNDPALIKWLEAVCGKQLQPSPQDDPHAYALYYYTEAGDHIGFHYDTSYYRGERFTVLIGLVDDSSSRLEYQLHRRSRTQATLSGSLALEPGSMVFFNGDKLYHRVTPLGENEERIALTLEYVTDPRMHPWHRFISNMKDAIAYFGFDQAIRPKIGNTRQ